MSSPTAVAQWIECLPGVWEVMTSIPVIFLYPHLCHVDQFTFHIPSPSLKFSSLFIYQLQWLPVASGLIAECKIISISF